MPTSLVLVLTTLRSILGSRVDLQLENMALRQQISGLRRSTKRQTKLTSGAVQHRFVPRATDLEHHAVRARASRAGGSIDIALVIASHASRGVITGEQRQHRINRRDRL